MKFYVSVDYSDRESKKFLPSLLKFLKDKKVEFSIEKKEKKTEEINGFDIVIAFGSSFNVLRTFRNMKSDIPVLGVSIYENEFLPEITLDDFKRLFGMIKNREYSIERRNRLEAFIDGKPLPPVLNEVVISANQSASVISYSIYIDSNKMFNDEGDGIIVSTPTGSTGYASSSGGPVILNDTHVIELTPLSSMQRNRPIIANDNSLITIKNLNSKSGIEIVCDGRFRYPFKGKQITIKRYDSYANFITIKEIKKTPIEKMKSRETSIPYIYDAPPSAKFILKLLQYEGPLTQKDIINLSSLQIRTVRHAILYLKKRDLIEENKTLRDARFSIYRLKN
jgi:Predicted sugar kinase